MPRRHGGPPRYVQHGNRAGQPVLGPRTPRPVFHSPSIRTETSVPCQGGDVCCTFSSLRMLGWFFTTSMSRRQCVMNEPPGCADRTSSGSSAVTLAQMSAWVAADPGRFGQQRKGRLSRCQATAKSARHRTILAPMPKRPRCCRTLYLVPVNTACGRTQPAGFFPREHRRARRQDGGVGRALPRPMSMGSCSCDMPQPLSWRASTVSLQFVCMAVRG